MDSMVVILTRSILLLETEGAFLQTRSTTSPSYVSSVLLMAQAMESPPLFHPLISTCKA